MTSSREEVLSDYVREQSKGTNFFWIQHSFFQQLQFQFLVVLFELLLSILFTIKYQQKQDIYIFGYWLQEDIWAGYSEFQIRVWPNYCEKWYNPFKCFNAFKYLSMVITGSCVAVFVLLVPNWYCDVTTFKQLPLSQLQQVNYFNYRTKIKSKQSLKLLSCER